MIAPALLLAAPVSSAWGDGIFTPGDIIVGGQEDITDPANKIFNVGTVGGGGNTWPGGESPDHAIDGLAQKYLNFGITYTGFLVNPSFNGGNGSVATSMQVWTANDAPERDPTSYEIWGTNQVLDYQNNLSFDLNQFTLINSGTLSLPTGRNGGDPLNNSLSQTVTFSNTSGYANYLIVFPTVRNTPGAANSMQIGEVQLFGIAAFTNLTWTGSVSNVWDVETTENFKTDGGVASTYSDSNGVTFDDSPTAVGATNITIANGGVAVAPATLTFANNSKDYTISGDGIDGTGSLTLNGTGTVTLNNENTYALGVIVNSGSLVVGATGTLGSDPLVVNNLNTGAATAVNVTFNSPQSIGSLSGTVATAASGTNTATIHLNGDLTVEQTTDGTYSGTIAGAGGLIKEGDATLILAAVNSYTGTTTVNTGTLQVNASGALPAGKAVTVNADATLSFNTTDGVGAHATSVSSVTLDGGRLLQQGGTHSTLPNLTLSGGEISATGGGDVVNGNRVNYVLDGSVTTVAGSEPSVFDAPAVLMRRDPNGTNATGSVIFNVPRGTAPVDLIIQSTLADRGAGLTKNGDGILELDNRNVYLGPTNINAGKVIVASSEALGSGTVKMANGTTLSLVGQAQIASFADFTLNNGAIVDGDNNVITLTDNGGSEARSAFFNTPVFFAGGFTTSFVYTASDGRAADGFTFTIQNNSPTALGGGGGSLGYNGIPNSGAVEFNIYTGGGSPIGSNVAFGTTGTYVASSPVNLASGDPIAITLNYDAGTHSLTETMVDQVSNDAYTHIFTNVDFGGGVGSNVGYIGFTGATGGAVSTQTVGNFTYGQATPNVSISNNFSIPNNASVTLEVPQVATDLTASASFFGAFTLGSNVTLNVNGGATPTDTPYLLSISSATLNGATTIAVANNGVGAGKVTVDALDEVAASNLIKTGPGTLVISTSADYTGTTAVIAGTLVVNGALSGDKTTVASGATLGGSGSLTTAEIASGATLSPGSDGIGMLTVDDITMQPASTLSLEIGTSQADQLKSNGSISLNGTILLTLALTEDPLDGKIYTILDGSSPLQGTGGFFNYNGLTLTNGQLFTVNSGAFSQVFQISYVADGGNDVTLQAIPEPGTAAAVLGGTAVLLGWPRRRRGALNG